MDLESVTQSEISQKEKSQCHTSMHICEIYTNGTNEPIFRPGIEGGADIENRHVDTGGEGENRMK